MALYTITKNSSESEAPHIYALDDAILNQGICAKYGCVLDGKDSLTVTKITDALVRIGKGAFSICGYQSRIDESGYNVVIAPTQTGYFKKTLIYAQIDATTLTNPIITIEQVSTTKNGSVPADPVVPYDTPTKNDVNTSVGGTRPTKCAMLIAIVNLLGTTITSITNLVKYLKNGERSLVWTNYDPSVGIAAATTISADLSKFNSIVIEYFASSTTSGKEIKEITSESTGVAKLMSTGNTVLYYRDVAYATTGITFGIGNRVQYTDGGQVANATYIVPTKIWGVIYGN